MRERARERRRYSNKERVNTGKWPRRGGVALVCVADHTVIIPAAVVAGGVEDEHGIVLVEEGVHVRGGVVAVGAGERRAERVGLAGGWVHDGIEGRGRRRVGARKRGGPHAAKEPRYV